MSDRGVSEKATVMVNLFKTKYLHLGLYRTPVTSRFEAAAKVSILNSAAGENPAKVVRDVGKGQLPGTVG